MAAPTTASTILARLQARDPHLRVIRFRRNFGQTAAFAAGFAHARGRAHRHVRRRSAERSARHPGDGRDGSSGATDIVCGWRKDRKDAFLIAPPAVDDRQRDDLVRHRRAAARLRLLAEGVSRRSRQADAALRRDAPLPAGDRQRARRRDRRDGRQSPRAPARARRSTASRGRSA